MTTTENTTTTPSSVAKAIRLVCFATALVLGIFYAKHQYNEHKEKVAAEEVRAAAYVDAHPPTSTTLPVEALVLEHECLTPCSANITWRFKIRTDGHPLRIKFQGIKGWKDFPAEGDFQAPTQMRSGDTEFVSSDPRHPHIRVQVYKRVII